MADVTLHEYAQEINGLIENNAYDEAIAHCKHILQQHPKYIEPYRLMGKAAWNREDYKNAADMFMRVLSADPSDFVSRAGLAVIHDKEGSLADAVWQMERAYELEPGNAAIQEELRVLYGRRSGVEPDRVPLTHGALARLYMNGELYTEATAELRAILEQEPDRVDLQALLAEALWRGEQRLEASQVALEVLDKMPDCLDANLILGEIWMQGGREQDADVHLKRAAALDPEGKRAKALFGELSPLPAASVEMPRLDYAPPAAVQVIEEAPTWLAGIGEPEQAAGASEEIPSWLQGIALAAPGEATAEEKWETPATPAPEELVPDWLAGLTAAEAEAPVSVAPQEEETPDWLAQLRAGMAPPTQEMATAEAQEAPQEVEIPDWLRALKPAAAEPAAAAEQAEAPTGADWLAQLRAETEPGAAAGEPEPEAESVPDWLTALRVDTEVKAEPSTAGEEEPEWLAQLQAQAEMAAPEPTETPDWLHEIKPEGIDQIIAEPEAAEPLAAQAPAPVGPPEIKAERAEVPAIEQAETPAWTPESGGMPTPEEAMAFFARLTAGKEAELQAQAQAEAEARMAEITGRKPPAKPVPAPEPAVVAPPEPIKVQEPLPAPVAEETPAWMTEGAEMPTPEEAMAFFARLTAGKEAELQTQAQAEAEARMAEITGRKPVAKPIPAPEPAQPPVKAAPAVVAPPEPIKAQEPLPAPVAEETPAWMTEGAGMPTPEEAMAFFAKLTAGKEAELQAQAQAEAEVRMAEITGRKPEAAPKPQAGPEPAPAKPPVTSEPVAERLPEEAVEEAGPAFPESISEWLAEPAAMEAAEIQAAPLPEAQPGWQILVQTPTAAEWPVEQAAPAPSAETALTTPELPEAEPAIAEKQAPAEAVPAGRQPIAGTAGPDWWYQTLEDEEGPVEALPEQITPEAGPVPFTEVMPGAQVTVVLKPAPVPTAPVREAARAAEPAAPPAAPTPARGAPKRLVRKPAPAGPPQPTADIESIMTRLRANPDDAQALLDLARAWVKLEDMSAARGGYDELIRRNLMLDDVISDLEGIVQDRRDDIDSLRLLGDAHMKAGHLQQALKLYRQALKKL